MGCSLGLAAGQSTGRLHGPLVIVGRLSFELWRELRHGGVIVRGKASIIKSERTRMLVPGDVYWVPGSRLTLSFNHSTTSTSDSDVGHPPSSIAVLVSALLS